MIIAHPIKAADTLSAMTGTQITSKESLKEEVIFLKKRVTIVLRLAKLHDR